MNDELTASESNLGKALALIHRALPAARLPERAGEVQAALRAAAALVEAARQTHSTELGLTSGSSASGHVEAAIVAVIAAAIASLVGAPHRIISVAPAPVTQPHLNVWAFEGRSQLFVSHKVR
ncbi:MAG TPA: hypothetical protein VHB20_06285 [Verrucomicrobiae bacterium]|jgi:hypothetical protein|nr:hypothetical protein [Verrucomicrobiae bacterium]